jgi:hypothetical protein
MGALERAVSAAGRPCAALSLGLLSLGMLLAAGRPRELERSLAARLARVEESLRHSRHQVCLAANAPAPRDRRGAAALASWATVAGCGAGGTTGGGGGIRWIGRNVTGGLFVLECHMTRVTLEEGRHDYLAVTQLTTDLSDRWTVGASVPYLYKQRDGFPRADLRLANRGLGDVSVLAGRRFGDIRATSVTVFATMPTGDADAHWQVGSQAAPLPQDLQLGIGRPSASLVVDHTLDASWGPVVLGGSLNHRGGGNDLGNRRAPTASLYAHGGYLLGPFVPALGLTLTGAAGHDASLGQPLDNPRLTMALGGSLEWSADWFALLLGVSLPYAKRGDGLALEPWVVGAGLAVSPL